MAGNVLVTASALNPAGVDILRAAGLQVHFCSTYPTSAEVAERCRDLRPIAMIVRQATVDGTVMDAAPELKVISKHGVGYDNIDVQAATDRGIPVVIGVGSNDLSVAEHALALSLMLLKEIGPLDRDLRVGKWRKTAQGSREVAGLRYGVIGFGRVGKHSARLARAVGFSVAAYDPYLTDDEFRENDVPRAATLDELLAESDVVSIHCASTPETRGMIDAAALSKMKKGGFLVNTARGGIVDETALLAALEGGHLTAAGLDVLETEPAPAGHPLLASGQVVLTPHVAGVTDRAAIRMAEFAARNAVAVLRGDGDALAPQSLINPEVFQRPGRAMDARSE